MVAPCFKRWILGRLYEASVLAESMMKGMQLDFGLLAGILQKWNCEWCSAPVALSHELSFVCAGWDLVSDT